MTGAKFDHVAHAAPRIRDLLPLYGETLGGRPLLWSEHEDLGYNVLQLAYDGGTKIELIEPRSGPSFLDNFLRRNPAGGLHHVTYRVPDLDAAVAAARAEGLEVFGVSHVRPEWREAFVHPRSAHGALIQFAQVAEGWPPPIDPDLTIDELLAPREEDTACPSRTTSAT